MLVELGEEVEDDSSVEAEYAAINSMLDHINSCLDHLVEKNKHLHARLQELLESNQQVCLEFQQQLQEGPPGMPAPGLQETPNQAPTLSIWARL